MEKKVTKEEVERIVEKYTSVTQKDRILNELFPLEFKVGDWVLTSFRANGWGSFPHEVNNMILQIESIVNENFPKGIETTVIFTSGVKTNIKEIKRHATPEEIAISEWEEGRECIVWDGSLKLVRVSSSRVGYFYEGGRYSGNDVKFSKYDFIVK